MFDHLKTNQISSNVYFNIKEITKKVEYDLIIHQYIDLFCITETWLQQNDYIIWHESTPQVILTVRILEAQAEEEKCKQLY